MNPPSIKPKGNLGVEKSKSSAKSKSPVLLRASESGAKPKSPTPSTNNSKKTTEINQQMIDKAYFRWAAKAFEEVQQKEKLEKLKELEKQTKEIEDRIERRNKCMERIKSCQQLQQLLSSFSKKQSLSDQELNNLLSKLQEITNSSTTQRIELKNICQLTDNDEFQKTLKEFCMTVNVSQAHLEMMETLNKLTQEYQLRLVTHNNLKQRLMDKLELTESLLFQYELVKTTSEREYNDLSEGNVVDDYESKHNMTEDDNVLEKTSLIEITHSSPRSFHNASP